MIDKPPSTDAADDDPGGELHQMLREAGTTLTKALLRNFLDERFRAAGHEPDAASLEWLVDQALDHAGEPLDYGSLPDPDREIDLRITEQDWAALEADAAGVMEAELPQVVERTIEHAIKLTAKAYQSGWPKQRRWLREVESGFQKRLKRRWAKALDALRMLLLLSRDFGDELNAFRYESGERWGHFKDDVIQRLHVRACRTTGEIIALLEGGYADGAMARWRTLHEIDIVMVLIADGDEELAERYLHHHAVEARKALNAFLETHAGLGYERPEQAEIDGVNARYDEVIARFGKPFGKEYGWAAESLGNPDPKFVHLAEAAGRAELKNHYKMASYGVHAGPQGIVNSIGMLGAPPHSLAGASNAGLEEPGQNTLISLTRISAPLFGPEPDADRVVKLGVLANVRDKGIKHFIRAAEALAREHEHASSGVMEANDAAGT